MIDGVNLGSDVQDLRVLFGDAEADVVAVEWTGGVDRLTVRSPPADAPGPVPVFVFRTRGLDFRDKAFTYLCDLCGPGPLPAECEELVTDCDSDGVTDACQLEGADCNFNGVPDRCDLAAGVLRDEDGDGVPDGCTRFDRADPNGDGTGDISDPLFVLGFLFLGKPADVPCMKSADANDDGTADLSDPILLLTYLFLGARAPPPPFQRCGYDPTRDGLSCETHAPCRG